MFNFLQALSTYQFNSNNALSVFYGGELGKTGNNAMTYDQPTLGQYGSYFANSQMWGAFYSYTNGNLNVVPEVQYVYANPDHALGINDYTSNFGAAVFTDYNFGKSPYSLGGMAEYFTSNGSGDWFIAPHAEGVGFQLSPTWQYKDLYARLSVGYMHLLNTGYDAPGEGEAFGNSGTGSNVVQSALELVWYSNPMRAGFPARLTGKAGKGKNPCLPCRASLCLSHGTTLLYRYLGPAAPGREGPGMAGACDRPLGRGSWRSPGAG